MHKRITILGLAACLAGPAAAADLPGKSSLAVNAGTLGIGIEFAHSLPILNLTGRVAWNGFGFERSDTIDGIDYDLDLDLNTLTALVDWRPFGQFTHFTAGVVYNNNAINVSGAAAASYLIGTTNYTADQVGRLSGDVSFDKVVPYVGLGWRMPVAPRTAISLDIGVMLQGEPRLLLQADGLLADDAAFQAELASEQAEAQRELSDYEYYPVIALGVQRRF